MLSLQFAIVLNCILHAFGNFCTEVFQKPRLCAIEFTGLYRPAFIGQRISNKLGKSLPEIPFKPRSIDATEIGVKENRENFEKQRGEKVVLNENCTTWICSCEDGGLKIFNKMEDKALYIENSVLKIGKSEQASKFQYKYDYLVNAPFLMVYFDRIHRFSYLRSVRNSIRPSFSITPDVHESVKIVFGKLCN